MRCRRPSPRCSSSTRRRIRRFSAQAAAFHGQFVQLLEAGAGQYALTDAANALPLQGVGQDLLNAVNAPAQVLVGRPLIGNGVYGVAGGPSDTSQWRCWRVPVR